MTGDLLWDFWHGVLHAAKRIPWRDGEAHLRLVALVRALKDRPDPPPPKQMTRALQNNWIWKSETLWSSLGMLGPSARESWNDSPGYGAGYELPEIHAWTNVNAFVAQLTNLEVFNFWTYCGWCMRDVLETEPTDNNLRRHHPATATTQQNAHVPAAAVWIMVLGKKLYYLAADETSGNSRREDFVGCGPLREAHRDKPILSRERWRFWKERLGILRDRNSLAGNARRRGGGVSEDGRDRKLGIAPNTRSYEIRAGFTTGRYRILPFRTPVFLSNTSAEFAVSTSSIEKKMSKKLSTRVKQHTFDLKREPHITKLINPEP